MHALGPHEFTGFHIFGELYGVDPRLLNNSELLEAALRDGIEQSGATLAGIQTKVFEPSGVTILALLSESHTSIHTYPEYGSLFFDAFTCGDECKPQNIAKLLIETLNPENHTLHTIIRGASPDRAAAHQRIINPELPEVKRLQL